MKKLILAFIFASIVSPAFADIYVQHGHAYITNTSFSGECRIAVRHGHLFIDGGPHKQCFISPTKGV